MKEVRMRPDDTEQNAGRCICPGCPTYNECMGEADEVLFCVRGATACGPSASGCICPECPVWATYSLVSRYFCMSGAAG